MPFFVRLPSQDSFTILYRDNAIYDFSKKAVENGLDIFRVFDSLNYFGTSSLPPPVPKPFELTACVVSRKRKDLPLGFRYIC